MVRSIRSKKILKFEILRKSFYIMIYFIKHFYLYLLFASIKEKLFLFITAELSPSVFTRHYDGT